MFIDRVPDAVPPVAPAGHTPRRAERIAFDMLARYAWHGQRGTALVKDLTQFGARIEGIDTLATGDWLTLLLPDLRPIAATIAWTDGRSAGLSFATAIPAGPYARLVRDFATGRSEPLVPARHRLPRAA